MLYLELYAIGFFVSMAICICVMYKIEQKDVFKDKRVENINKNYVDKMTQTLINSIEEQASIAKKNKIMTMCSRAGLKMNYGQYIILCSLSAITVPIISYVLLKNEYLLAVSFPLGFTIPSQVIAFMCNRRIAILDKQIGSFLQIVTERYSNTKDFAKSLKDCTEDFKGSEPLYNELLDTVMEIELGVSVGEALKNLSVRTGNKYINRLSDYYSLSIQIGTDDARSTLLKQAYLQYEESRSIMNNLKAVIAGPANEAYLMIGFIPLTVAYNSLTNDDYLTFMTTTMMGKIGMTIIFAVIIGGMWLVNTKISAPID